MSERNVSPANLPFKITPALILLVIGAIIVIYLTFSSAFIVGPQERAIILFLGKYQRTVGPGLHFKIPFSIEKQYVVLTERIITQEYGFRTITAEIQSKYSDEKFPEESIMLTGDKNIVDIEWIIQYQISDPLAWLFNVEHMVKDPGVTGGFKLSANLNHEDNLKFEKTIRDISQSVINQLVGDRTILGVIGGERVAIQSLAKEFMNTLFDKYKMGVKVTTVELQDALPPEGNVRDAFEDVNKAEQDKERTINEGNEQYNKALAEAEGKAKKTLQEAQGYAFERVNIAQGDVARFKSVLEEYRKAPDVTRSRLYIEMWEQIFKTPGETDLIDRNLKNFIPLKTLENTVVPATQAIPGGAR